jgi:hypothetical protein
MVIENGHATIYFGGGFGHWGYSTIAVQGGTTQLKVAPGLWFWSEYGLPPDSSKLPYYRTCKWLLMGSAIFAIAGIAVLIYRGRRRGRDCVPPPLPK